MMINTLTGIVILANISLIIFLIWNKTHPTNKKRYPFGSIGLVLINSLFVTWVASNSAAILSNTPNTFIRQIVNLCGFLCQNPEIEALVDIAVVLSCFSYLFLVFVILIESVLAKSTAKIIQEMPGVLLAGIWLIPMSFICV